MKNNLPLFELRLRDMPLSVAGVLLGIMLATADYHVDIRVASFLVLTTLSLHLLSASADSKGFPLLWKRIFLCLTIVCGIAMLYFSFGTLLMMEPLIMMVLGYMVIRAVKNTYFVSRGKGIAYVFLIFGPVAVYGSYYICSHTLGSWTLLFTALSMGFLSVAARADDDRRTFRTIMMSAGWVCMIAYACLRMFDPWHFLFVLSLPLFMLLKKTDPAVLAFAVLTGMGFLIYLM